MSTPPSNTGTRTRAAGFGIIAAGLVILIWRGILATRAAQGWLHNRVFDPSMAELDAINFWIHCGEATCGAVLAWAGRRMLKTNR